MNTIRRTHEVRRLLGVAAVAIGIAIAAGAVYGFTVEQWLVLVMGTALVLWVGGAVAGHVVIARILDVGTPQQLVDFTRVLTAVIPAFFVPNGFIALGGGIALALVEHASFLTPTVLIPIVLLALTTVVGVAVSAPGYTRLLRVAAERGADDPQVERRLRVLAWVNRTELVLVIGLGFTSVVSALR